MLNAAFVGFGRMGITHFSILNSHPDVNIAAVCDTSRTMLRIIEKHTGVATYTDFPSMLDQEKLDFLVVSTPADSHAAIIEAAIERGLHVFCEKPFVLESGEGNRLIARLDGKPVVNQIGYVNRFNEVFLEVKRLLDVGAIGTVRHYSSEMYGPTVLKDAKSSWRGQKQSGGGCMFEFASHCIDLAVYLLGSPERVTGSVLQSIYSSKVEDLVTSTFIHPEGYSGNIRVNWSDAGYRKPTNIVTILGTEGKIIADKHGYKIHFNRETERDGFHQGWNTRYITDFAEPVRVYVRGNEFTRQLDYFVDCIRKGAPAAICDFKEAYKTDLLMERITEDAERRQSRPTTENRAPKGFWGRMAWVFGWGQ